MNRNRNRRAARGGLTLIEVLLVLVILVILGSIVGVGIRQAQKKALRDAAEAQLHGLKQGVKNYELDIRRYPTTLQALVEMPSDLANPQRWREGGYLDAKQLPVDPWDSAYQYELVDSENFRIWSNGPDGQKGSEDDIVVTN